MHLHNHLDLLERTDRSLSLKRILRETVRPGSRVLDAGTGTGILAVWSAQAGAAEVVGVDVGDVSLARALAEKNGVADRVRFVQADLAELDSAALGGRFDLFTGMLYYNDPRRDEAQALLSARLHQRFLAPGGQRIPDRVEYVAIGCHWPGQDVSRRLQDLGRQRRRLEASYDLRLGPLFDAERQHPPPGWFPPRGPDGALVKDGCHLLTQEAQFATVDYGSGFTSYPPTLELEIAAEGVLTAVVWVQSLYHGNALVFCNESVSWVRPALAVRPGERVALAVDDAWRRTNQLAAVPNAEDER